MIDSDFSVKTLITSALSNAGLISIGRTPPVEIANLALQHLNWLIASLENEPRLFAIQDIVLPINPKKATYTIGKTVGADLKMERPVRVLDAHYEYPDGAVRSLTAISVTDYNMLVKGLKGAITQYYVQQHDDKMEVSIWPAPDKGECAGQVHLTVQTSIPSIREMSDKLAFPKGWFLALMWELAAQCASGQPENIVQYCNIKAREALTNAKIGSGDNVGITFAPMFMGSDFG